MCVILGRKSQEREICELILNELYDINQKRSMNFNTLFKKIKGKRGRFSFDTLTKYLKKMENDGRIIRIIDVNSNRKIKPTLLFKNNEVVQLQNEKMNFNRVLMDKNTKFYQFPKKELAKSDLIPKFNEVILKFLKEKMNINVSNFDIHEIIKKETLVNGFDLFLLENPELKGAIENFNDIVLLFYLNIFKLMMESDGIDTLDVNYNLLFQFNFTELVASIISRVADTIQQVRMNPSNILLKIKKPVKISKFSEEEILQLLLNQLKGDFKENIKETIQKKRLEEFSEKYKKGLKIY